MCISLYVVDTRYFLRIWMEKWDPELSAHLQQRFLENPYAKKIVDGTNTKRWTMSDAVAAVRKYKKLEDGYRDLDSKHPPKKNPSKRKPPRSSGSRKPRKPKPSSGRGSATKRPKRKKQFENNDQYYSASQGHRPRGRATPMSGKTCNSCGSPIRWDGNCNCS